ncbi:MAG: hypothetical protein V1720_11970 [bacterium]
MKKFLILFLTASAIFSQTQTEKSVIELKQEIIPSQINQNNVFFEDAKPKKSAGIAILYSLLLPGMGELYAGDYSTGMYLTIADGVFWSTLAGLNIYGNWQMDNYKSFAASNGNVNLEGKDEDYFATITDYISIDEYNEYQSLHRNYEEMLDREKYYWEWDNVTERREYRNMWSSSEQAYNNIRFAAGALLLNRVISAINAVRLVSKYNKNLAEEVSWNVNFGVDAQPTLPAQFTFNFVTKF